MLSLAFECAGRGLSAALAANGELLGSTALTMDRGQPAALMPALSNLLDQHGVTGAQLQRVGCTLGPGGFTGIRLGIATALGLARSSGAAFFGFNAFDVYALAQTDLSGLCILIESRRAELFARIYGEDGTALALTDSVMLPEDVPAKAPIRRVIGSAASRLDPVYGDQEPDMAVLACHMSGVAQPSALSLLDGARDRTVPLYLRAPEIGGTVSL